MKNNALNNKMGEKYFFTANIFDEEQVEEIPEEVIPPPPVFSEAELDAVRRAALGEGKNQGMRETEQSRDRYIAETLERIAADTAVLFAAEHEREKLYEQDVLKLCLQVFAKLFPLYNQAHGFDELKHALTTILKKQEAQQKILVAVAPEFAEKVAVHLETLKTREDGPDLLVKGDPSIPPGGCKLSWHEGGAMRNPEILAEDIKSVIEQALAGSLPKGHDTQSPAPAAQAETVEKPS